MSNIIGKALVLFHLVISLICMSWGAALYLQQLDWGWKEPRKDAGVRIPSEYDKRAAALSEGYRIYLLVEPRLEPHRKELRAAEKRVGDNHMDYVTRLAKLHNTPDPIKVREIKYDAKQAKLVLPDNLSAPQYDADIPDISKSLVTYFEDLRKLHGEFHDTIARIDKLTAEQKVLTLKLRGDEGNQPGRKPGLYDLLELEKKLQDQIRFEKAYIRPIWVRKLDEAGGFLERKADLEETLNSMKKKGKGK